LAGTITNKRGLITDEIFFGMAGFCGGIYSEDDIDILGVDLREL